MYTGIYFTMFFNVRYL